MNGGVYFEGDPATDSARRHMERVLKGEPARRWPWYLAALGSVGVWFIWRSGRHVADNRSESERDSSPTAAAKHP